MHGRNAAQDAVPVSEEAVRSFRLSRHHLDRPAPMAALASVAGDACGIQAQVMAAAQLALRVRVRGATTADVNRALWEDRSLARVWCMRGTIHLVPSAELAAFVRGCTRVCESRIAWAHRRGLGASLDRMVQAASAAMDQPRTRAEIAERISAALGVPIERRGGRGWGGSQDAAGFRAGAAIFTVPHLAFLASYEGLACFGPDEGDGSTFVRPEAWLPDWRDASVEDAEERLLRTYLRAFAPATVKDFQAWVQMPVRGAREVWSRLEGEVRPVTVEGRAAWVLRDDLRTLERATLRRRTVRLLPYFDSFLMGHKERGHLVEPVHRTRIYRPAGWIYPAVLVDGRVQGEWGYKRASRSVDLRVRPYRRLSREVKDLVRAEAADVARFLGTPEVRVTFAKVR